MKFYCVCYSYRMAFDSTVRAENKKEAIKKVKEIVGEDIRLDGIWEIEHKAQPLLGD